MKVFISWSKAKSREFAIKTKELLESVNPKMETFVSEVDINAGEEVQDKIIEKIESCEKLVLCFTKENKKSPWLLFEAGYARGVKKTVIPLLFDNDPNWHSWIDNPMNIAREIYFYDDNFIDIFITGLSIKDTNPNKMKIKKYIQSILDINEKYRNVDIQCEELVDKLIHNDSFVIENPFYQDRIAHFLTGFESYDLYKTITESFMYTGKYLWIYGRRNMKLFGGNFANFFKYLEDKSFNNPFMDGIDFRCLFLDPNSDEVNRAHSKKEIFIPEMNATILRVKDVIKDNMTLKKCFKFYSNRREEIIIRLDNCIIYSRPNFDAYGRPQILTNTGFEVFSTDSPKGQECIKKFEYVWNNARSF